MDSGLNLPYREKFIYGFSFVGITSTLVFGVYVHASEGNYAYAVLELVLVLIAIVNLIYFHFKRNYELASNVILALMIVILSFLVITGGYRGTGIVWIYTFPLLSFFMKSFRTALFWNFLLVSIVGTSAFLKLRGVELIYYDPYTLRQALGAYLAVSMLSFFYSLMISKLLSTLNEKAIRDVLTGLHNRAFVFETLEKIVEISKRNNEMRYCLVFIDIDNFKSVNDTFGHDVGDRVLVEFSSLLRSSFRKGDVVGRVGGDEFVVLVYNCNRESLLLRLEELRKRTEKEFRPYGLSISYGVVEIPSEGLDVNEIVNTADSRMYDMKRRKRS